jgi:hypothetical protein
MNKSKTNTKKYTKDDKKDVLLYYLNKDKPTNQIVSYTNLSKAKVSDIDKLLLKHNLLDNLDSLYDEYMNYLKEIKLKAEEEAEKINKERAKKRQEQERERRFILNLYEHLSVENKKICDLKINELNYNQKIKFDREKLDFYNKLLNDSLNEGYSKSMNYIDEENDCVVINSVKVYHSKMMFDINIYDNNIIILIKELKLEQEENCFMCENDINMYVKKSEPVLITTEPELEPEKIISKEEKIKLQKDNKKLRNKSYYEKNKHKQIEEYVCVCGCKMQLRSKTRHLKTKVHLNFVNNHL